VARLMNFLNRNVEPTKEQGTPSGKRNAKVRPKNTKNFHIIFRTRNVWGGQKKSKKGGTMQRKENQKKKPLFFRAINHHAPTKTKKKSAIFSTGGRCFKLRNRRKQPPASSQKNFEKKRGCMCRLAQNLNPRAQAPLGRSKVFMKNKEVKCAQEGGGTVGSKNPEKEV